MIKRMTRVFVVAGVLTLVPEHFANAAAVIPSLNWPLPISVTAWLLGAGVLAVVGFFGRRK